MEYSESQKEKDFNYVLKAMNYSFINPYYFEKVYFLTTQEKVVEILDYNKIKSVEVIVYVYDVYLYMKNYFFTINKKKGDFLFINDKYIQNAIKDYLVLMMFQDINSRLGKYYSDRVMEGNKPKSIPDKRYEELADNDYYRDFKKFKNDLPYYKKFLKLYNSQDTITKVLNLINENIDKKDFYTLSSAIDFLYNNIKNEKPE